MTIMPIVRCRRLKTSLAFYTQVLDFDCVEHAGDDDPSFSLLMAPGGGVAFAGLGGAGANDVFERAVASHLTVLLWPHDHQPPPAVARPEEPTLTARGVDPFASIAAPRGEAGSR